VKKTVNRKGKYIRIKYRYLKIEEIIGFSYFDDDKPSCWIYLKNGKEKEFSNINFGVKDLLKVLGGEVVGELD